MKHSSAVVLLAAIGALAQTSLAVAEPHYGKVVSKIEVAISGCYFFQLSGVDEADPVVPNSPWFAILTTQANAKEMYAVMLTVRTTGATLERVVTNGQTVCGHAQVSTIDM